jgi:microcystin-dependent protein
MGLDNMGGTSANRVTAAQADTLGGAAGAENHTLTVAQMPVHNHGVNDPGHAHTYVARRSEGFCIQSHGTCEAGNWQEARNTTQSTTGISVQNAGSGQAHNNMQPSIALNYVIKY